MIQYAMTKNTAPLILASDVVAEMQSRYPDRMCTEEQSPWLHGVDAGYQMAINEMLSIIKGDVEDDE